MTWVKYQSSDSRFHKFPFLRFPKSVLTPYNNPEKAVPTSEPSHFIKANTDLRDTLNIETIASQCSSLQDTKQLLVQRVVHKSGIKGNSIPSYISVKRVYTLFESVQV